MKRFAVHLIVPVFAGCALAVAQVTNWTSLGIGGGGALYTPSFNPHNPAELYSGCDMSELFHSQDTGRTWTMLHFSVIQGGNKAGVQFTSDAAVRYAVDYSSDQMRPVKSSDAGLSWHGLPGDPTGASCWSMAVDPTHTTNLLLVDYMRLYGSTDGGSTFSLKYTSSSLGGAYIAGTFWDGSNVYVGMNKGMLVSTDGGVTFNLTSYTGLPAGQGLLSFAGAKQGDTVRFFGVAADTADIYVGIVGSDYWNIATGIYTIDWGRTNWTRKEQGIQLGTDFPFYVGMARDDVSTAYLAGSGTYNAPSVFKTTNGGGLWAQTFRSSGNQNISTGWCGSGGDRGWGYAECAMGFSVAGTNRDIAAFSDYGFIHVTADGGATWRQCYVTQGTENPMGGNITPGKRYEGVGLENTTCWDLCWLSPDTIYGSFTDIQAIRSFDGGLGWSHIPDLNLNTTYRVVEHPVTGALYAALSSVHDLYQSTYLQDARIDGGSGAIRYSTNRGQSWSVLHNFGKPVIWVELDPNRPNRMYAAVVNYTGHLGGIWVTEDLQNGPGASWTRLPEPPRTQGHPYNIRVLHDGMVAATYSGRRDSTGRFTASSGVFVSADSGRTWQDRSDNGMRYWTMDLVIDPYDSLENTWFGCVFSGWGGAPNGLGGLYRSTNRGVNWTRINDLDRVGSCTVSPRDRNEMYLTTEVDGLWLTGDIRQPNPSFELVQSYPFRHPQRVLYDLFDTSRVWVTSFGAGVMVGGRSSGIVAAPVNRPAGLLVTPNPARQRARVQSRATPGCPADVCIFDVSGKLVRTVQVKSPDTEIGLSGFPAGVYLVEAGNARGRLVVVDD